MASKRIACQRCPALAGAGSQGGPAVNGASAEFIRSQLGAVILPPMLTYYDHPASLEDCTRHTVNRILSHFDLDEDGYPWEGMDEITEYQLIEETE